MSTVRLRPATVDDVPAIGRLARAREAAYEGGAETTDDEIAHDLASPDVDLSRDAWIAIDVDGAVIGYADVLVGGEGAVNGTVWTSPDGSATSAAAEAALFDALEGRAAEMAREAGRRRTAVHVYVVAAEEARLAALGVRGYAHARTFHRMVLPPSTAVPEAPVPRGLRLDAIDRDRDAPAVHDLLRGSFAAHGLLGVPDDLAAWRHETIDEPRWVPGPSLVALAGEVLVGAVVGFPEERRGWVRHLGVAPGHRGRGLGAALLAGAFRSFRQMGLAEVGLGVDSGNDSGATRLYERMGMVVERRVEMHELLVPAPSA